MSTIRSPIRAKSLRHIGNMGYEVTTHPECIEAMKGDARHVVTFDEGDEEGLYRAA